MDDDEDETVTRRVAPRRRRARMGQVVGSLGKDATATATTGSLATELLRREQAAKAKVLLEGGKNKGEQKGYGATAGKVVKP